MHSYVVEYLNENEFKKKERSVKKYNMLAYKKLLFEYYPSLREGNFLGVLVSSNSKDRIDKYELKLPTDKTFIQVHGNITLHYSVYLNQKIVMLETLTPEELLSEGHQEELIYQIIPKVQKGKNINTIASEVEKDVDNVKLLYDAVVAAAPDYDIEKIMMRISHSSKDSENQKKIE